MKLEASANKIIPELGNNCVTLMVIRDFLHSTNTKTAFSSVNLNHMSGICVITENLQTATINNVC